MSFQDQVVMNVAKITSSAEVIDRTDGSGPFSVLTVMFEQDHEASAEMKVFFTARSSDLELSRLKFAEKVAEAINAIEWEDGI